MTGEVQHEARKEALDALRPLVTAEETGSSNLNARALGVISASSVVTAIAAFFAKDVLSGGSLEKLGVARYPAVVLLVVAVVLLALTVIAGVHTLRPRTRAFILPDGLERWKSGEVEAASEVRLTSDSRRTSSRVADPICATSDR